MTPLDIESRLADIEADASLLRDAEFPGRARALEALDAMHGLEPWQARVEAMRDRLEAADEALFRALRERIRTEGIRGRGFRDLLIVHAGRDAFEGSRGSGAGYDRLDEFLNGLLHARPLPEETRPRESGMVFYQKTPARIILDLVDAARLAPGDLLVDVGSGLGQVALLAHLLSGAAALGIEREPAYCGYARACAAELGLTRVEFLEADARDADYARGTVFFLYTPFEGPMLDAVLEKIEEESPPASVLFTYGPCTPQVAGRPGLTRIDSGGEDIHALAAFRKA